MSETPDVLDRLVDDLAEHLGRGTSGPSMFAAVRATLVEAQRLAWDAGWDAGAPTSGAEYMARDANPYESAEMSG